MLMLYFDSLGKRTLLTAVLTLSAAARVQAHDPPEVTRINWLAAAADAHSAVFQTVRGFVIGDTQARSYRWACIDSLGLELGEQPGFVVLPDNSWMVATENGLKTSADQGCSWLSVAQFGSATASALLSVADDSKHLLLALAAAADGGLYESQDSGGSWKKRLNLAADDYVAQIAVAPTDPSRIYLSGLVIDEATDKFSFQLTRSRDGGATWDRAYIPLGPDEDRAVLAAVSPSDPDTLVVLANNHRWGEVPDRALYSTDAGSTYRELTRAVKLTSATFNLEGNRVILAGGDSLSRIDPSASSDDDSALQKIGESQLLSCAQPGPEGLYACGHVNKFDPVNAGVFVSRDDGESWQSLMAFTEVKQAVQCSDQVTTQQCKDQWTDWQLEILVGLGGAPIDSVAGWQDFKGIQAVAPAAPAHTLATAKRGAAANSGGEAMGAAGTPAATSSSANGSQEAANNTSKAPAMTSSGGCSFVAPTVRSHASIWGALALFCSLAARRRHRSRLRAESN